MSRLVITDSAWRPLRGIDRNKLNQARFQAHHGVQWLSRAARGYILEQPDDGHTNLGWEDTIDSFVTQPMQNGLRLCLSIANLTLSMGIGNDAVALSLDGRNDRQTRQWLGELLAARNLDANSLDASLPYALPAQNTNYDATGSSDALAELAAWFANAEVSLGRIRTQMTERKLKASDVRCWPHHFDLATLISFPARNNDTGYVGVGLSPGDGYYDEPYFYVSIYPKPDPATLPGLPKLGHWHYHEFTAAIAPSHKIFANDSREAATDDFLKTAVDHAIKILQ